MPRPVVSARDHLSKLRPGESRKASACAGCVALRSAPSRSQLARSARSSPSSSATSSARRRSGSRPIPEALRARMRRYFEDLRTIIERHGGTVEKFVGDAVMAVFGIPCPTRTMPSAPCVQPRRCAPRSRSTASRRGSGSTRARSSSAGEGETLVTGDAVNVAARLEQAAGAGETLIGAETRFSCATRSGRARSSRSR